MNIKDNNSYKDERGEIRMILEDCGIGSISRITTKPNSVRANHWHKKDTHFIEIIEGTLELYERRLGSKLKPTKKVLNIGDIVLTPRRVEHTMYFPCDCVFNCYSKLSRKQSNYEKETVRFDYNLKDIYDNWKD